MSPNRDKLYITCRRWKDLCGLRNHKKADPPATECHNWLQFPMDCYRGDRIIRSENYGFTHFAPPRMSQRVKLNLFAQYFRASSALCQLSQSFASCLPPTRRSSAAPSSSSVLASVILICIVISPTPACFPVAAYLTVKHVNNDFACMQKR